MDNNYEKRTLEGGYGYLITIVVFVAHLTTVVPLASFGIIHGKFLASLGDEISATSTATSVFVAILSCSGILAGTLFKKFSYRKVGILGAILNLMGGILLIFADKFSFFLVSVSILQALGGGLLLPSAFSTLNEYFHKKLSLQTAIAQILITVATVVHPMAMGYCNETYGYKTTKIILIGLSCLTLIAMWLLHPVEWHMDNKRDESIRIEANDINHTAKPLLDEKPIETSKLENHKQTETSISKQMSYLDLLKSPKYLNLAIGNSLTFHGDNLFISMLGSVLRSLNYSTIDIAKLTMLHFGCDLVSRIIYAILSAFYSFNSRYLVYGATLFTAIFRIAFIIHDGYTWRLVILAILGFIRSFIQTPYSLVIAESYRDNFSMAYTLFCTISGVISLLFGQLMNLVKRATNNDEIVVQVLTAGMVLSVFMWTVEFVYIKLIKRNRNLEQT